MSQLNSTYLKRMCDPSWVAKAYSEYLLDCANAQSQMLESLSNLCNDEDLSTLIDEQGDILSAQISNIQARIENRINELYSFAPIKPTEFVPGSQTWKTAANNLYIIGNDIKFNQALTRIKNIDTGAAELIESTSFAEYFESQTVDDMLTRSTQVKNKVNEIVDDFLGQNGYDSSSIYTLDSGFVNMRQLVREYVKKTTLNLKEPLELNYLTPEGYFKEEATLYLDEVTDNMKSSFASCIAWGFAFDAIREINISDAIAKFDALVSTIISDTTEKFSSIINTARATLTAHINSISSFFAETGHMLGWDLVSEELFDTVENTDVYAYTGASPIGSVNLNSAKGLASAVGKTVLAVGAGVFSAAKSLLGKLWNKAKPLIRAITNDPVDIAIEDDKDDSYACSNFKYSFSDYLYLKYSHGAFGSLTGWIADNADAWYAIKTIFGEVTFRMDYDTDRSSEDNICLKIDMECRISNISYRKLLQYGIASIINRGTNEEHVSLFADWDSGITKFDQLIQSGDYRPSNDEDETYLYMGFIMSALLQASLGDATAAELSTQMESVYNTKVDSVEYRYADNSNTLTKVFGAPNYGYYVGQGLEVPNNVTNLDFIKATSGFRSLAFGKTDSFESMYTVTFPGPGAIPVNTDIPLIFAFAGFIVSFLYQQYDKYMHPTDYLFLPYCKGTYTFTGGRYRIKTDSENANVASLIASALLIIFVVAVSVVLCKTITKIFKAKKVARLKSKINNLDGQMRFGKRLSTTDAVKYQRYSSKLNKVQNLSSGFVGSGSKLSAITNQVSTISESITNAVGIDPIQSLVQGQLVASTNDNSKDLITLIKGDN